MKLNINNDYIVYFAGWRCGYLKSYTIGYNTDNRPYIQVETLDGRRYNSFTDIPCRLSLWDNNRNEWITI